MQKYSIILLDVDNTLLDFTKSEHEAFNLTLDQYNLSSYHYLIDEYIKINEKLWQDFEKGLISKDELVNKRFELLFKDVNKNVDIIHFNRDFLLNLSKFPYYIEGAKELLESLKGKYILIGLSNGVSISFRRRLIATNLISYLDYTVVSEEAGYSKPDPRIFEYTFKKCGLNLEDKEKTIILGDSYSSDILGGINFKIDTCLFNPLNKVNKSNIKPTYEINKLSDFLNILEKR
jgi:YjjG family noncanonical pyrimidine nucleotidase